MIETPKQASAGEPGERWRARRIASWSLRVAIFLAPLVAAVLASLWLSTQLPDAVTPIGVIAWWLTLIVFSSAVAWAVDRLGRRLLPLTVMLKMTMLFPDRAPSRFKVALRSSNVTELRRRAASVDRDDVSSSAELILSLASALNNHDRRTRGHGERTRAYTDMLADELRVPEEGRDKLRWAALLHDIGKLEVPAEILNKDGRLDDNEMAVVKRHPLMGMKVAAAIVPWLGQWAGAIEHHHEWWDGTGYPGGLSGGEISLAARIVAVADAYDVMTSGRVYQTAKRPDEARREVASMAGTQFDPLVARALLNVSLGKLRWALGPMALLGTIPFMFDRIGRDLATLSTAATVTAAAAFTGIVAAPALSFDAPPAITAQAEGIVGGPQDGVDDGTTQSDQTTGGGTDGGDIFSETSTTSSTSSTSSTTSTSTVPTVPIAATTSTTTSTSTTSTTQPGSTTTTTVPATTTTTSPPPITTTTTTPPPTTTTTLPPPTTTTTTLPPPPPVANDDEDDTPEDSAVVIAVLANDEGGSHVDSLTQPGHGTATQMGSGEGEAIRYTPAANWWGTDTFTYIACITSDRCGTATVTVTVTAVNDTPEAVDDTDITTNEDSPVTIDVLDNDIDADGELLKIDPDTLGPGAHGTTETDEAVVTYTPNAGFHDTDTFTYIACDPNGACSGTATVTITVNGSPEAADDTDITTNEDVPINIDVLANDTDPENDPLTIGTFTQPPKGDILVTPDEEIEYTPNTHFNGTDTFTYTACDPIDGCSSPATVTITVNGTPEAVDDTDITTNENTPITIDHDLLLNNDTDPEDNSLTIVSVSDEENGTATLDETTITYTPEADFNGTGSFSYTACDANDACDTAMVTVTVVTVIPVPDANDDSTEAFLGIIAIIDVLDNDTGAFDPDTLSIINQPAIGTAWVTLDNRIFYLNLTFEEETTVTFPYQICDVSDLLCDTATVTITLGD